jgi:tryptophan-rich hypothetical protein
MNQINPEKLIRSKWTAVEPRNRQRHFIVTRLIRDENERLVQCELQAVINRETFIIDWKELKNTGVWQIGWK